MKKLRILICGASGFIGNNILIRLATSEKYDVVGTYFSKKPKNVPKNAELVQADLTNRETVFSLVKGFDVVLDYAAIATNFKDVITRPYIHTTDNVIITSLLIRAAHEAKIPHFIFPSCGYLYNTGDKAFREEDVDYNNLPKSYFGAAWSKTYCEKMCEFYSGLGNTKFTVFRQANIYGPNDKTDMDTAHALPATIMKILGSTDGKIQVWGDGSQLKDQLYIDDILDLIELVIERKKNAYDFVNVGSGAFVSMKQIAEEAVKASGKSIQIEYDTSKPSSPMKWRVDSSRAKEVFGWSPRVSLAEGMKKTCDWYKSVLG